jgi:hypothetical protein
MTIKAEQILAALETKLSPLSPATANVTRAQVYSFSDVTLPAINIRVGPDIPAGGAEPNNMVYLDWELTVYVDLYCKTTAQLDTTLNALRLAVHQKIMADYTLGLSFVYDGYPGEVSEPQLHGEGEEPVGFMRTTWRFFYQANLKDPSL